MDSMNKNPLRYREVMKFTLIHLFLVGIFALMLGGAGTYGFIVRVGGFKNYEGFDNTPVCNVCGSPKPCGCRQSKASVAPCPPCREPDMTKYILKSQIPSRSAMPDLSQYMLKTECPPVADLSKYVLRSSIPKPQPVIIDNSSCMKSAGECPPCPRARCPEVKCAPPTKCPAPAPCPRPVCPPTVVKCKSEESTMPTVRPFLAPLNQSTFGGA